MTKVLNKIRNKELKYSNHKGHFTGGEKLERINPEELKKELFEGIPSNELSESSKRKLNLIMGVQCDSGKTVIRHVIREEMKVVNKKLDAISTKQTAMVTQIKAIKREVGGLGNGGS